MSDKIEPPKEITAEILGMTFLAERTFKLVDAFKIDSNESYTLAAEQLKKIKDQSRELTEERLGITRPMDEAKKKIMAHFKNPLDFLAKAEQVIKKGMVDYNAILEKKRLEEQKRLDDEAEKLRLEEVAKAEQEKKDNPESGNTGPDMTADVVPDPMDAVVVPAVAKSTRPVVKGVSVKKIWSAEIVDEKKIIEGVLAGTIPMAAITINQSFFNTQAKALKEEFNYPGAVAKSRDSIGA